METLTSVGSWVKERNLLQAAHDLGPLISQSINEEERTGRLSTTVVDELRNAGFYKLFLPKSLGGLEADPLTTANMLRRARITRAGWSFWWPILTAHVAHLVNRGEEIFVRSGTFCGLCSSTHESDGTKNGT